MKLTPTPRASMDWRVRLERLDQQIQGTFRLRPLLRRVLHLAMKLTGAERGFVIEWKDGQPAAAISLHHRGLRLPPALVTFSRTIARQAMAQKEPLVSHCAADDPRLAGAPSIAQLGIRAVACFPFTHNGQAVGALYLDSLSGPLVGVEVHRELLEAFAARVGRAGAVARMLEEKEAARKEMEARLAQTSAELARSRESEARVRSAARRARYQEIIGRSAALRRVFDTMDTVVATDVPVIVLGETGVGKELVARALHENGPRRNGRFVAQNCAALAESLLESELFGHVAGAFTDARRDRPGLFEVAHQGTLFLDEIGDIPLAMQVKLLRVLETGQVCRVGSAEPIAVDVRIVSATNQDLAERIHARQFREALYYRLSGLVIPVPPLRQRREDIPLLVASFLDRLSRRHRRAPKSVEPGALAALARYPWPGNIRQLDHVLQRLMLLPGDRIRLRNVRRTLRDEPVFGLAATPADLNLRAAQDRAQRECLAAALKLAPSKAAAARLVGIDRTTFHRLLRRHGLA